MGFLAFMGVRKQIITCKEIKKNNLSMNKCFSFNLTYNIYIIAKNANENGYMHSHMVSYFSNFRQRIYVFIQFIGLQSRQVRLFFASFIPHYFFCILEIFPAFGKD